MSLKTINLTFYKKNNWKLNYNRVILQNNNALNIGNIWNTVKLYNSLQSLNMFLQRKMRLYAG